jgi:hypothetical protein
LFLAKRAPLSAVPFAAKIVRTALTYVVRFFRLRMSMPFQALGHSLNVSFAEGETVLASAMQAPDKRSRPSVRSRTSCEIMESPNQQQHLTIFER